MFSQGVTHHDIHGDNMIWDYINRRVVFIDLESTVSNYEDDRTNLALVLWQLLYGVIEPEIEDDIRVENKPESLIVSIQNNRADYPEYKEEINRILQLVFSQKT
jgi:hypothetical protein